MTDGERTSEDGPELIAGRYRLDDRIGSGAMGVVWRALDIRLDRTVAVKQLLLPPGLDDTEMERARQRTFREGRIAARLQHPNAISVYNVADHENQPVLVMEYLPSRSLAAILDERGTLPVTEAAHIGAQAAAALTAAHGAGVVHRDVKPGNILLAEDGTAKITDFGISRAVGDITVTSTGLFAGTPAYLAPETARGAEPDAAADVFSLGACLFAAVEGRPPFDDPGNEIAMLHAVASGRIVPPSRAGILTSSLRAMLRTDPGDRPLMAVVERQLRVVAEGIEPPEDAFDLPTRPSTPAAGLTRPAPGPGGVSSAPGSGAVPPSAALPPTRPPAPAGTGVPSGRYPGAAHPGRRSPVRLIGTAAAVLAAAAIGILVAELLSGAADSGSATGASATGASASTAAVEAAPPSGPPGPAGRTSDGDEVTESDDGRVTSVPGAGHAPGDADDPDAGHASGDAEAPDTGEDAPNSGDPADPAEAVREYYDLLPGDTDAAWRRLGPTLREQGRDSYDSFWAGIDAVELVGGPRRTADHVVEVTVDFTTRDGRVVREKHRLSLIERGGRILIDGDELLSSTPAS